VLNACKVVNQDMLAEYTARNPVVLQTLVEKHSIDMRSYPNDVIAMVHRLAKEVVSELAEKDPFSRKVYDSYQKFLQQSKTLSAISELAYLQVRDLG